METLNLKRRPLIEDDFTSAPPLDALTSEPLTLLSRMTTEETLSMRKSEQELALEELIHEDLDQEQERLTAIEEQEEQSPAVLA